MSDGGLTEAGDTTWISDLKAGAEFVQAKHATLNTSGITPTEYKVLIRPDPVEEITKGGIILATETTTKEKWAQTRGTIVAVSHLAFSYATAEEWQGKKPQPGQRVIFAKYAGVHVKGNDGAEYIGINDKDVCFLID